VPGTTSGELADCCIPALGLGGTPDATRALGGAAGVNPPDLYPLPADGGTPDAATAGVC
jgi:hypothetical protein